ncbi:MAG: PQQ-binding-like beta-propeller repeat protein [Bacteroidales bacterium]
MKRKNWFSLFFLVLICIINVNAQDWPQFLGPDRNSTSPQKKLLRTWPAEGPQVLWTAGIGIGYGGPVVKDGKIYLFDRMDSIGDIMRCFDLPTGKELWNFATTSPADFPFPGSRSVPAIDGNYVYGCGAAGDLYCIDINTHKPVWNKNIWKDFGGKDLPIWAISQCPLIYKNMVIVSSHAPDAGVVAFNKLTGELVWKTPNLGNETYVSPSIIKISGEDQVVMVTSSTNPFGHPEAAKTLGKIIGMEPLTGKVLWEYNQWECHISVANVVEAGDNKLLLVGGYELGCVMIKVEKKADNSFAVTELFKHNEFGDHTKPPIIFKGYFYGQFTTNGKRDGLVCMDMEGKIMWKTKNAPKFDKGSMILADGLILATDGATKLYLIEPDPSAFKSLASADILKQGGVDARNRMTNFGGPTQNWAPIALADGKLLIRDQSRLMCVKVAE